MSDKITLSMVMPTYNQRQYIEESVNSALAQTRQDFELIIVNDGSTDGTKEWLDAYAHPKVRVIHQENGGPAEAINTGMKAATGDYVTWISSDNICLPHFFEVCMAPLELDPSFDMSYSTYANIMEDGSLGNYRHGNLLALRDVVSFRSPGLVGFIYKRKLHEKVGWYRTWSCDTEMWGSMLEHGVKMVHIVEPTQSYRFHDDRASVTHRDEINNTKPDMLRAFYGKYGVTDKAIRLLYPSLSVSGVDVGEAWHDYASRMICCGLYTEAGHVLLNGIANSTFTVLPKLFRETIIVGKLTGNEALPAIEAVLAQNPHLNDDQRKTAMVMAQVTEIFLGQAGDKVSVQISPNQLLVKHDLHFIFSYEAWKQAGLGISTRDSG